MEKSARLAWDKIFKEKGKVFTKPQKDIPRIVKLFNEKGVKKVLDLGCGSGRHLVYLARHGFDVHGIDISKRGIKIARKWLKKEKLKTHLRVRDIYKQLPYKNNFFDAIISTQTLHHGRIENIRKLIKEMKRILRPKGLMFITVRKEVAKKYIPRDRLYGIKYIAPRNYVMLSGPEKGLPHYRFNKKILRKEFKDFKVLDLWIKENHYCLLGQLKNKK